MMSVILSSVLASAGESYATYNDRITVRASGIRPSLNLTVERDSEEILFLPNTMVNGKVGFSYRGFGFSFGTEIDGSQKDEEEYGKTEYIDYQLKYFKRNLGFVGYFQQYGGFYLENPGDYGNVAGDSTAKRKDLKVMNMGVNAFYIFSERFSLNSSFDQTEKQLRSGGSFLAMVSVTRLVIESDRSLIPPARETRFADDSGYKGGKHTGIAAAPGVGYTFVFKNFFVSGAVFLGMGIMQKIQENDRGEVKTVEPYGKNNLNISIGYNSDFLFGGLMLTNDSTLFKSDVQEKTTTEIRVDSTNMEIYAGIRW
jgi:hypothetical protein